MTPEAIEPVLAAISGGAATIAGEMAFRALLGAIILGVLAVVGYFFFSRAKSDDLAVGLFFGMLACGLIAAFLLVRAVFIMLTPHLSAISYLSGVLK